MYIVIYNVMYMLYTEVLVLAILELLTLPFSTSNVAECEKFF